MSDGEVCLYLGMTYRNKVLTIGLCALIACPGAVYSQAMQISNNPGPVSAVQTNTVSQFSPRPSIDTQIDFSVWDALLKEMVYYAGPSLRTRAPKPNPVVGTRFVHGHVSPYRLEGNRIVFETFGEDFKSYIDYYANDLIDIGNQLDIPALPRSEQLAYWLNLHNVLVIKGISDRYPTGAPSRLKGKDGLSFHDTKRVTVDGTALSLRDIREDIVYRNWSNPMVIYGFFHGDIGSPSIQRKAFTSDSLNATLRFSANEFVNSLRGFHIDGRKARISRHYQDAAPYYFRNFDDDVRTHLSSLMSNDVKDQLDNADNRLTLMRYETATADLTKGDSDWQPFSSVQSQSLLGSRSTASLLQRAIAEHRDKMEQIRRRDLLGTVTITDIQTVDDDSEDTEPSPPHASKEKTPDFRP